MASPLAVYKLTILYMLDRINGPIAMSRITEFLLENVTNQHSYQTRGNAVARNIEYTGAFKNIIISIKIKHIAGNSSHCLAVIGNIIAVQFRHFSF